MHTSEGLPVVKENTLAGYLEQIRANKFNYKTLQEQLREIQAEQPVLSEYILSYVSRISRESKKVTPGDIIVFASQVYKLLKTQAEINKLESSQ